MLIHQSNADSPTPLEDGSLVFVKPHEEDELFDDFLDYVSTQEKEDANTGEVRYAQTREDIAISSFCL